MNRNHHAYMVNVLIWTSALVIAGCSAQRVPAPTAYESYNAKDGSFQCEFPAGWESTGGGTRGVYHAKFTMHDALIKFNCNVAGSLLADIAKSGNRGLQREEIPEELEPVAQLHERRQEAVAEDMNSYQEEKAQVLESRLGPGRMSEFTAATTFGTSLHGYRVTVITHKQAVSIMCICPEDDWQTLQPAFQHVLTTLKRGYATL